MQKLKLFPAILLMIANVHFCFPQTDNWLTHYELSGYISTPRYKQTIEYAQRLAGASDLVKYTTFGVSPQGRGLPLLIIDKQGFSDALSVRKSGKVVVLIQACIHAGESDGKDAGLMLIRDMAIHSQNLELLDSITILFVPIFNVDGHEDFNAFNRINQNGPDEMGKRVTAQRLNLNRDYIKADAPEMQAMIRLYQEWLPDFYIDCHVTDGADYIYPLTYGLDMHGNLNEGLTKWLKGIYLPYVSESMKAAGFPIAPYLDFVEWHNPLKGIRAFMGLPRYSDGYAAVNNRPALLIETHMLKGYKTRVDATYRMLLYSLECIHKNVKKLITLNAQADLLASGLYLENKPHVLSFKASGEKISIPYQGYDFEVVESDISGGEWYQYSEKPLNTFIDEYQLVPDVAVQVPDAYVIPVEWSGVIEKLQLHGAQIKTITRDTIIEVQTYKFRDISWKTRPFEGRHMMDYELDSVKMEMRFPAGSKLIPMNQRSAQVIMHLLEPQGPDALLRWGFMNSIFEQKEYAESYVMEEMAREMLRNDPSLLVEYNNKMSSDKDFASSPYTILNWFYQKSPYWDAMINIYPIGKIFREWDH